MWVIKLSGAALAAAVLAVSAYGMTEANPDIIKHAFLTVDTVKVSDIHCNYLARSMICNLLSTKPLLLTITWGSNGSIYVGCNERVRWLLKSCA